MRTEHHKLVRDRIPELLRREGLLFEATTLQPEHYQQALRAKLVEEAREAAEADQEHVLMELADLAEVMDALLASARITRAALPAEQERRRTERGGFEQRLWLLWTEPPDAGAC
jgi:predicted house-cleaning noncanonical NTP pyrophosphatase (MazG superfamily)